MLAYILIDIRMNIHLLWDIINILLEIIQIILNLLFHKLL